MVTGFGFLQKTGGITDACCRRALLLQLKA